MERPQPTTTQYLGKEGEDPTSPFWASGNYVGPYWSNGKLQESVEWGDKPPLHELDELARQHDAAYAHYKDEKHREAADMLFAEEAKKLKQKYGKKWAEDPQVAARFVEYGNHTSRQVKKLAKIGTLGPAALPWLVYHQIGNMIDNHKRMKGTYLNKEVGDVRKFYSSDPKRSSELERGATGMGNKTKPGIIERTGNNKVAPTPVSDAPKKGPTAAHIHHAELIESQRNRMLNYNKLRTDAINSQGQKPKYKKKKQNFGKATQRTKKFSVVPVRS